MKGPGLCLQVLTIPFYTWSQALTLAQRAEYLDVLLSSQSSQLATSEATGLEPLCRVSGVLNVLSPAMLSKGSLTSGGGTPRGVAPPQNPLTAQAQHQQLAAGGEQGYSLSHNSSSSPRSQNPYGPRPTPSHGSDTSRVLSRQSLDDLVRLRRVRIDTCAHRQDVVQFSPHST